MTEPVRCATLSAVLVSLAGPAGKLGAAARRAPAVARRLLPHVDRTLLEVLRGDRLLAWATLGLWVAALLPLFVTHFLPFADLPINTAAASLLWDTARGHLPAATYYRVNWAPVPYWVTYLINVVVEQLADPLVAAKVITALILLLLPLGIMRLLVTLGRSPRLALWAFILGYEHNMYAGWHAYLFGIGLSFFVIAWTLEARTLAEAARVTPMSALVGLTHAQAVALVAVTVPPLVFMARPFLRRLAIHAVASVGCGITMLPWLFSRGMRSSVAALGPTVCEWHTPASKLSQFFGYTLDDLGGPGGERTAAMAFVVLVVGPLLLSLLPRQATGQRARAAAPAILLAAAGGLYALLPFAISGIHWYTYPRYATVFLLFALVAPAPRLDGRWALALLPGVAMALAMDVAVMAQFRVFERQAKPLLAVIDRVKPGAAVLPLVFDDDAVDPDMKLSPWHQMHAYVAAFRKGYEGYLWNHDSVPLLYRQENRKPAPFWGPAQNAFAMDNYGKYFDYVLVQGFRNSDPVARLTGGPLPRPALVIEAGRWRLYEIQR